MGQVAGVHFVALCRALHQRVHQHPRGDGQHPRQDDEGLGSASHFQRAVDVAALQALVELTPRAPSKDDGGHSRGEEEEDSDDAEDLEKLRHEERGEEN